MSGTVASTSTNEPVGKDDTIYSSAYLWQQWALAASTSIIAYCGISIGILFLITWLILTGSILEAGDIEGSEAIVEKRLTSSQPSHLHTMEFYTFVMTVLVAIRGALYYMARALQRAASDKDSRAIGIWLITSVLIMLAESLLAVALLKCLPGTLSVILLFLIVELIAQGTLIWVVWNFKLELGVFTEGIHV